MALDSYSGLKTEIEAWLSRNNVSADIDTFIDLAEAEFNKFRVEGMEAEATISTVSDQDTVDLPADYLELISKSVSINGGQKLTYVSKDKLKKFASGVGQPTVFTFAPNKKLRLAPTPDGAYDIDIEYYQKITPLSDTNTTNWLLDKEPQLYLLCAQKWAYLRFKDHVKSGGFEALFDKHKAELMKEERSRSSSGGSLQVMSGGSTP